jgi:hypothetical protein
MRIASASTANVLPEHAHRPARRDAVREMTSCTLLKRIKGALEFCAASNIQRKPDYNIYCAYEEDL